MSRQLQAPVPLVSLVKTESLAVIKNEPPEEALEKEISSDIKNIDIVYHSLSEDLIKSETVPENILETKYLESQVLVKTEDTSDENVTRGTGQEVIEVQGSNEYSNVLSNLETDTQLVLNFSKDLNGISTRTRKAKQPEKTNFAKCYKTVETTSWKKDIEERKVIKAPVIPIEAHEYTSLAKDKYVCNHCQQAYNALSSLGRHIKHMHRKHTTMYQCPYCSFKSKWSVKKHIILKHRDIKDIQWFQCHLCEKKFKLKDSLTQHMKVHLTHEQMQDLKRYHCNKCNYRTDTSSHFKMHNLVHLNPEEIEYFYCYHCSYKCQRKHNLKSHIFRHHFKNVKQGKSVEAHEYTSLAKDRHVCNHCQYACNKLDNLKLHIKRMHREVTTMYQCPYCPYKSKWQQYYINQHIIQKHKDIKDIQWFQCNLCEMKFKLKKYLTRHMKVHLTHEQMQDLKRYHCDKCDYKTYDSAHLKTHNLIHLKPEEIEYFYCYHCSYKSKLKMDLKRHIFRCHYKNVEIKQEKRFPNNLEDHCSTIPFDDHVNDIKKQKSEQPESTKSFLSRNKSVPENSSKSCSTIHFDDHVDYIKKEKSEQPESTKSFVSRTESVPENSSKSCSTIHFDDHVNYIKKQKSEQPESTKSFVSRTELLPENSSKSYIFQCTYCPTKFPEEHLLKGHLQLHSRTKGIECPICTYRHNKTEILKHLSWHGANGDNLFICPICHAKKRTKENMDDHLKVVHSKAIYQNHDSVCKKKICNGFCK